jgi:hypothetical protein
MKRPSTILLMALGATPVAGTASAEHAGPAATFRGATAVQVAERIAEGCGQRGFSVARPSETEVVCQGGDLVRSQVEFRPGSPAANPKDAPQIFHRFAVSESAGGARVTERSTATLSARGRLIEVTPRLTAARVINARLEEFYRSLGGTLD